MKPRISRPAQGNKYYINTADGGYNAARGNPSRLNKDLTSLPNCVAIYGWFNEIGGQGMKYLKTPWYPHAVIQAAMREGLEVAQEPEPGGIMVWTGGKTGEGHVAGVGEILADGRVFTVESEYYGRDWATFARAKGDGNWRSGCYWMNRSYQYQGCIRNPFMECDMTKAETEALIREMFPRLMDDYKKDLAQQPADQWAESKIERVKKSGLMVGDPDGNFRPQSDIRREEVAVILANILPDA